jgi:polyhydroxyalkanoate synthesis regulator phasin
MLIMESIFKRIIDAGIGVASKTGRFAEKVIRDLVDAGKISEEEGKKIINDLEKEGNEQRKEFENEMTRYVERVIQKMDIPSRADYLNLEKRVELLEISQPGAMQINKKV